MASRWPAEKELVLAISREMAARGLVTGTAGNVSLRLGHDGAELLAITPSRKPYAALKPEEIQVIDFACEPVEGDLVPSVESLMHVAIYRARPDVRAVVHTHSVYASALAVAHLGLPPILDEMVTSTGGEVSVTPYAFPSSEELAAHVAQALAERNATLLANHGVVGVGSSLREALGVCEVVERAAQVYVLARALGSVHPLPEDVVAVERGLFKMLHFALKELHESPGIPSEAPVRQGQPTEHGERL